MDIRIGEGDHFELENVEFFTDENEFGQIDYCLSLTYIKTNQFGKWKINYPKVVLPILKHGLPNVLPEMNGWNRSGTSYFIDIGLPETLPLLPGGSVEAVYTVEQLEEYVQEMTLEEVEKKLGHKVKLVTEEKESDSYGY